MTSWTLARSVRNHLLLLIMLCGWVGSASCDPTPVNNPRWERELRENLAREADPEKYEQEQRANLADARRRGDKPAELHALAEMGLQRLEKSLEPLPSGFRQEYENAIAEARQKGLNFALFELLGVLAHLECREKNMTACSKALDEAESLVDKTGDKTLQYWVNLYRYTLFRERKSIAENSQVIQKVLDSATHDSYRIMPMIYMHAQT